MWRKDASFNFDPLELPQELSNNYSHIAKYSDIKTKEKRKLHKANLEYEKFRAQLSRVVRQGALSAEQKAHYEAAGWKLPPEGKITLKADVDQWVNQHPQITEMTLVLHEQNDIIELLDTILKALHSRGYSLDSAVKIVMFNNGR